MTERCGARPRCDDVSPGTDRRVWGFLTVLSPAPKSHTGALYDSLQSCRTTLHVVSPMAVLPAQLHVKLTANDSKLLARLAKKAKLSISETIRQLIRNSKVASTP